MNQIYGSSDRDEAMILETLILMNRERDALQQAKSRFKESVTRGVVQYTIHRFLLLWQWDVWLKSCQAH